MRLILDAIVFFTAIGIAAAIIAPHPRDVPHAVAGAVVFLVFFLAGISVVGSFGIVDAGDVGVVTQWGKPTGELKQTGLYTAFRPLGYAVYVMQASAIRSLPVNDAEAASSDLQTVKTDITMNFHLNPDTQSLINVYATLRDNFDSIINPLTLEALKAVTAHYTAQDLIDKRARVKDELDALLRSRLDKYGIIVDNVSLTQFRFSDQFNAAIEAKVTQEQSALQARAKLSQVQYEAQQTVVAAKAQAESLALRRQNITQELVEQNFIDKWDGHMPVVMGSGGIVNLPQSLFEGAKP